MVEGNNITPDSDRINRLIKQLSYTTKAGDRGEKENAKKLLNNLCLKYGIDCSDIENLDETTKEFKYSNAESKFILAHCIWDVVPDAEITSETSFKKLFAVVNVPQQVEILERYKHYWKLYRKEKKTYMEAFVLKNNIGVKTVAEPTEKGDKEKDVKLTVMMSGIKEEPYIKNRKHIE